MTFTNDDLMEYKERAIRLDHQQTLALLARLEAAEKVCLLIERAHNHGP
jgi:hypothetical protein